MKKINETSNISSIASNSNRSDGLWGFTILTFALTTLFWGTVFSHFTLNITGNFKLAISDLTSQFLYIGNATITTFLVVIGLIVMKKRTENNKLIYKTATTTARRL